jgi:hypothetical protein
MKNLPGIRTRVHRFYLVLGQPHAPLLFSYKVLIMIEVQLYHKIVTLNLKKLNNDGTLPYKNAPLLFSYKVFITFEVKLYLQRVTLNLKNE